MLLATLGQAAELALSVVEGSGPARLPARIHVRDAAGRPHFAAGLPRWHDHFIADGTTRLELPAGTCTVEVERGPEWTAFRTNLVLDATPREITASLARIAHLPAEGWWSGDTHVHRAPSDADLLLRAEDLHGAQFITWWNQSNPWTNQPPPSPAVTRLGANRWFHVLAGEDERDGGALLFHDLSRPLDLTRATRHEPSSLAFARAARREGARWIEAEKPFWWDFPLWLAHGMADTVGIAHNHLQRGGVLDNEAWGRPRDRARHPGPQGNGRWTQEIYYHALNCGLRLPPTAGSASGVLPNPVGYNRAYVQIDGEPTPGRWTEGLRAGRSFVSNGPLLRARANGQWPGHVFRTNGPLTVLLEARLDSRDPVAAVELVRNGRVEPIQLPALVTLHESGWFLLRAVADVPHTFRFASTAPFYVEIDGQPMRPRRDSVQFFLDWCRERQELLRENPGLPAGQRDALLEPWREAESFWAALQPPPAALVTGRVVEEHLLAAALPGRAAGLPPAEPVEIQPLLAQVRRLGEALEFLGQPLAAPVRQALADAARSSNPADVTARIEAALDPLCLGALTLPRGAMPRFTAADTPPPLLEQGWRMVLVKVINPAGATGTLRADSPGARPLPDSPPARVAERWIDLEMINRRPLNPTLGGLGLEYRLLGLWARQPGRHSAEIAFQVAGTDSPAHPPGSPGRLWNFDADPEGWQARNQVRLDVRDGTLVATSEGSDPFFDTPVDLPKGRLTLRFRARTHTNAIWQLFWWTERHPQPDPRRQVAFPMPHHDGRWSEQVVTFEPEDRLQGIRLDPGSSPGESAFDWIQLESNDPTGPGWARAMLTFPVEPARPVVFRVTDEKGQPATAAFVVRDGPGRVYPMQSKRLGGDFFFQPQVYRHDGETLALPDGEYTVDCSRGPESVPERQQVTVGPGRAEIRYQVRRWIDPAARGWYSGDHHIHAAGCLHYNRPEEGVRPEDMQRHLMGEDLKVGCNLTWGPGFDFQKQFFRAGLDPVSRPPYLLRYDIEVSGFGSHQSGHLNLLRLRQQMPPGGDSTHHWPTLGLNTLRWAKRQGAVCGPAHSASGLEGRVARVGAGPDGPDGLPSYDVPPYDGIGANEFVVDITHEVPGPDGRPVPAVDFISTMNTTRRAEWNMWYHALNCGFRVRASGETDFPCITGARVGAGRVYVRQEKGLDFDDWVEGLREGRSYVSDGTAHLLDFHARADGQTRRVGERGSEVRLARPQPLRLTALAAVRHPGTESARVDLVVNGRPVQFRVVPADGRETPVTFDLPVEGSSWVALRIGENAHTNPFFVLVDNRPIRADRRSAEWLLAGVDQCWTQKERTYADAEKAQAREAYEHARQTYRRLIAESPEPPGR